MAAILIFKCKEGAGVGGSCKMAARNAKRSMSTILQENRGLWTVYAEVQESIIEYPFWNEYSSTFPYISPFNTQ